MFCENCGKQLADGSRFCDGCGSKIENQASGMNSSPTPPPPPQQNFSQPPQQNFSQPPQQQNFSQYQQNPGPGPGPNPQMNAPVGRNTQPLTMGQYLGMLLLMVIPLLNIILLFVWAFGSDVNLNKKNFARAGLILLLIGAVFYIVVGAAVISALGGLLGGGMNYGY